MPTAEREVQEMSAAQIAHARHRSFTKSATDAELRKLIRRLCDEAERLQGALIIQTIKK